MRACGGYCIRHELEASRRFFVSISAIYVVQGEGEARKELAKLKMQVLPNLLLLLEWMCRFWIADHDAYICFMSCSTVQDPSHVPCTSGFCKLLYSILPAVRPL